MFWESVGAGLKVLTYWQTYVAGLEYLTVFLVPMFAFGMITQKNSHFSGLAGCLSVVVLPVVQVAAMAIFILTLAPIILGLGNDAAWSLPWNVIVLVPGAFFKLVGILIVATIALAFIPILGRLHSLQVVVLGGVALTFVLGILESITPGTVKGSVDFIPGFWFSVGLLVLGGFMSWIGIVTAALALTALESVKKGIGQLIMYPVGAIFGFIPVFIYGAWLGAQLRGGIPISI